MGYNNNGHLTELNRAVKENFKTYLKEYKILLKMWFIKSNIYLDSDFYNALLILVIVFKWSL